VVLRAAAVVVWGAVVAGGSPSHGAGDDSSTAVGADSGVALPDDPERRVAPKDRRRIFFRPPSELSIDPPTFDRNSAKLSAAARAALDVLIEAIRSDPDWRPLRVRGHADRREHRPAALAAARARAVRDYVISRGLDPGRVNAEGRAASEPRCREPTDACAGQNRRVDVSTRNH